MMNSKSGARKSSNRDIISHPSVKDHPKLPPSSYALLNVMMPQASTSTQEPMPSTSKNCDNHSWQQSLQDLEADERLARQLAEEEEIQYRNNNHLASNNANVNCDADETLARQLAQEEEDMYFSAKTKPNRIQPNNNNSVLKKSKQYERREYNPINFSNVVIHTKSSKKVAKQIARRHQYTNVTTNNDTDTSHSLAVARMLKAEPEPRYPNVYDALLDAKMILSNLNNQKVYLPQTSTRKSFSDYEEITVKKLDKIDLIPEDKLVTIADNLDAIGRVAFSGCARLNPMQSTVFETAYKTNKNMLVAAPTGAGKTNVAMLTVLNELRNHFKPNTTEMISKNFSENFKIIYIAPMKSLATEQTENFNSKLKKLGIKTSELTGDMSMTADEMAKTHIIVTTPEKWDVVTRKSKGDIHLLSLVRLLIVDEVHLLQSDRGPVLEAIVSRTLRYVEYSQRMTRIIGLSATLPNYVDVARFLRVDPYDGLFYFDNRFRPVPLTQTFIGVRPLDTNSQSKVMDKLCYNMSVHYVSQSKQLMIFVHARNSTQRVANKLREMIQLDQKQELFQPDLVAHPEASRLIMSPKNASLRDLFNIGFGIHHAGMVRHDRLLVERLFREGILKVLVCTATLAWGVNFPAHAVIIRGTEIYDASVGKFVDVGLLDVMQIFGRAGRPQYDSDGHAIIMTALDKMDSYLKLLTNQTPIESNFTKHLTDNLNAEIVAGTVSNLEEGASWLRYTYLNVRLSQNPLVYGIDHYVVESDPTLSSIRLTLITAAARQLDEARMCRFDQQTGELEATDLGRIASHFYINYATITRYNEILNEKLHPPDVLGLIGEAQEFQQIKFREEEASELDRLRRACYLPIAGGVLESTTGKVSCLLQAYITRSFIESHSLISDLMYIAQNATRIARGLFEYAIRRGWPTTALNLLLVSKMIELRMWNFQSPLRHFDLPGQVITRIEESKCSIEDLDSMTVGQICKLINFPDRMGKIIKNFIKQLPYVIVEGEVKPIKLNLLVMNLTIKPYFEWSDRYHGKKQQSFWLWVSDEEITDQIYHSEHIKFTKEHVQDGRPRNISVNIPLIDVTMEDDLSVARVPNEYIVHIVADDWSGCDYEFPIDCRKLYIPDEPIAYTRMPLNLNQLPLNVISDEIQAMVFRPLENQLSSASLSDTVENDPQIRSSESLRVDNFNILQSQVFHPIYKCDKNVLVCAPSGSGKTLLADLAALRVFETKGSITSAKNKVVYISPIGSLVSLRYRDWFHRFRLLQKNIIMLDEQTLFNRDSYDQADVIVSSAEKFYIWLCDNNSIKDLHRIALFIFDDLHLINDHRGSHLEVVISKLNYIKTNNNKIRYRYVALSNTVANCHDLAGWLGIKKSGAYNFHAATSRPIQLEIHVQSFPERHYLPRMSTMNKPIYKTIIKHSIDNPVIVFVSVKKQCSLTALDLVSCLVHLSQSDEKRWLHIEQAALNSLLNQIQDEDLKLFLEFGIGLLYPSMKSSDKKIIQELYNYGRIQVIICTANYAWDSDLRAYLVIVKDTEHYDSEKQGFVDYAPADVMQMLGKAGRPNLDSTGIAVLLIKDTYKEFYKKFLYEPFPVESNLLQIDDMILKNFLCPKPFDNQMSIVSEAQGCEAKKSEIPDQEEEKTEEAISRTLEAKKKAMKVFTSTFLARRISKNPSFYGLSNPNEVNEFLSNFLDGKQFFN